MSRKTPVKRSTVKNHVTSTKHAESKVKYKKGESRDGDIVKALQKYDQRVHPVGQTISGAEVVSDQSCHDNVESRHSTQ